MTSDAKLAVFKEEFSVSVGWSGHAPSGQQRKPNLSQAPPAEIASTQEQRKERNRFGRLTFSLRARGCVGLFLWPSELSGPQLLAYPSQVKQLVFSLFIPTTAIPLGDSLVSLCSIFAREWSGSPQPGLKFARRLP